MEFKILKKDTKNTDKIGFDKAKVLKMTGLCLIASTLNNLQKGGDVQTEIEKKNDDQVNEVFKSIIKSEGKIIPLFDNYNVCIGIIYYENKEKEISIVYRGTDKSRMHEVDLDLNCIKQPVKDTMLKLLSQGKVHKGFLQGFYELYYNLIKILYEEGLITTSHSEPKIKCTNEKMRLNIVGHSLGGTKAVNTTVKLREFGFNTHTLLLASPKNFSFSASEEYDQKFGKQTLRIKNSNDPVPRLPKRSFGFHNVGYKLNIPNKSSLKEAHLLSSYYNNIQKLSKKDFIAVKNPDYGLFSRKESLMKTMSKFTTSFIKNKKLDKLIKTQGIKVHSDMVDDSKKELLSRDIKPYDNKKNNTVNSKNKTNIENDKPLSNFTNPKANALNNDLGIE